MFWGAVFWGPGSWDAVFWDGGFGDKVLSGGRGEGASHGYLPGKSAWTA